MLWSSSRHQKETKGHQIDSRLPSYILVASCIVRSPLIETEPSNKAPECKTCSTFHGQLNRSKGQEDVTTIITEVPEKIQCTLLYVVKVGIGCQGARGSCAGDSNAKRRTGKTFIHVTCLRAKVRVTGSFSLFRAWKLNCNPA